MEQESVFPDEAIAAKVHWVRGQKVMLAHDLATMYGVPTFRLNEAVKRNLSRFPEDFMFPLTNEEWANLTSQIAISRSWGGRRQLPYAFTEHGVLMLSSVLNSDRAIAVNIRIVRVFVRLNRLLQNDLELQLRMERMESRQEHTDAAVVELFEAVKQLLDRPTGDRLRIGYRGGDPV
ncbi:MAG: ORF6N domain-containing protein [Flavobacteriales bacterium]|nr:ORF6N domain-containing protein [Flavobacteriales bacterium]